MREKIKNAKLTDRRKGHSSSTNPIVIDRYGKANNAACSDGKNMDITDKQAIDLFTSLCDLFEKSATEFRVTSKSC